MPPPRRRPGERPGSAGAAERGRESARRALHDERGKGRARRRRLVEEGVTDDPDRGNHVPRSAESDRGSKVDCRVNAPLTDANAHQPLRRGGPTAEWSDPHPVAQLVGSVPGPPDKCEARSHRSTVLIVFSVPIITKLDAKSNLVMWLEKYSLTKPKLNPQKLCPYLRIAQSTVHYTWKDLAKATATRALWVEDLLNRDSQ